MDHHPYRLRPRARPPRAPDVVPRPWGALFARALAALGATWLLVGVVAAVQQCGQHDPGSWGTVRVAIVDCREPQAGWIAAELQTLGALGPLWLPARPGDAVDVTVRCADTGPAGGAEEFTLGTDEVRYDPTKPGSAGEFGARSHSGHGLFHWHVNRRGPHPDRARLHVCSGPPTTWGPNCYRGPFGASRDAMMVATSANGDPDPGPGFQEVWTGTVPQHVPVDADIRLWNFAHGRVAE